MTRVDFYVVDGSSDMHDRTLCRVVEKAWQRGHAIFVNCTDDAAARRFDELLWQFQDTSFVPHALAGDGADDVPIIIGTAIEEAPTQDVLLNLVAEVPAAASRFERVIESAGHDEVSRRAARARYRFYQERGFPLHTHKIAR